MITEIEQELFSLLQTILQNKYSIELPTIHLFEIPADMKWGDLSCRAPFILSKIMKKPPLQIAQALHDCFNESRYVKKTDVAGNGFINIYLDRKKYIEFMVSSLQQKKNYVTKEKMIIEHTNINPNKAAHVGHIRNACLGDTLARMSQYLGYKVEVQNYIDDTGVQLADVVVGFVHMEKKNLGQIKAINETLSSYCWDLYSSVSQWYEQNEENKNKRFEVLKLIEDGNNEISEIAKYIAEQMVKAHLKTMERLDISYDLLTRESDIVNLKFWESAFQALKEKKAVQYSTEGKFAGCWILPFSEHPELAHLSEPDKILVRSNGTLTYVAKDIAYQLWKFGLLNNNFYYDIFHEYSKDHILWHSTSSKTSIETAPSFGNANRVYNVIDVRQAYLQKIVAESLKILGYEQQSLNSIHFSYEIVALSPKSCKDMNISLEEFEDKDFIGMSGRKGIGIKADDFIDAVERKCYQEIMTRNPSVPENEVQSISKLIARAAIRYYMLKFSRNKIIIFDTEDALNFDGETGPYLQYTGVRANNIINKLIEKNFPLPDISTVPDYPDELLYDQEFDAIWGLVYSCSLLKSTIHKSLGSIELSLLAKHVYTIAQKFNYFYYHYDVIHMPEQERIFRAFIVNLFRHQYKTAMQILGLPIPYKM